MLPQVHFFLEIKSSPLAGFLRCPARLNNGGGSAAGESGGGCLTLSSVKLLEPRGSLAAFVALRVERILARVRQGSSGPAPNVRQCVVSKRTTAALLNPQQGTEVITQRSFVLCFIEYWQPRLESRF